MICHRTEVSRQRGSVLIVSLIMLVVLTLLAISAINMSTTGLRMVNAMQARGEATSAAQRCVEQLLGSNFAVDIGAVAGTCNIAIDANKTYAVTLTTPCLKQMLAVPNNQLNVTPGSPDLDCYQGGGSYWSQCADTVWELTAAVNEGFFGANVSLRQGIALRMDNAAATAYKSTTSYHCS